MKTTVDLPEDLVRGLKLRAYTVNDANQARALLADGLDGLFTDRLDLPSRL